MQAPPEPTTERRMLMATFVNRGNADRALEIVASRPGYSEADVSVLRADITREKYFGDDRHEHVEIEVANKVPEGASICAFIGAIVGGFAAAFGAISVGGNAIAIPALGIALEPTLSAILAGIGTGGTLGGLIGALIGAIFPEERAVRYKGDFERGGMVLGMVPHNEEDGAYFKTKWDECSGERVYYREDGAWDLFKAQLLEMYDGEVTDSGLDPYKGEQEKLIGHIQEKTGQSYETVGQNVRVALEKEHYSFGEVTHAPSGNAWEAFKRQLMKIYEGLSEDEVEQHRGERTKMEGLLQEKTGQSHEEVKRRIDKASQKAGYRF